MKNNFKSATLISLTILAMLTACQPVSQFSPTLAESFLPSHLSPLTSHLSATTVKGKVEFPINSPLRLPSLTKRGDGGEFSSKALISDIAPKATVSLIYPSDNSTNPNVTVATGLTDSSGNFIVNPSVSFNPAVNDVYILEAGKRMGDSGNAFMTLRTYIRWNGSGWDGMTTPDIFINTKTTALAIIQNNIKAQVSALDTIGKIDVSGGTSVPLDIGSSPVLIASQTVLDVSNLVTQVLSYNYDPMYYIKLINSQYQIVIETPAIPPVSANLKPNTTDLTTTGFTANWSPIPDCTYDLAVTRVSDKTEIFNQNVGVVTTYSATTLAPGTQYTWKVRAKNTINNLYGNYASVLTFSTPLSTPVATSQTNVTTTSFTANWNNVTNATGYKLFVDGLQYPNNTTVINSNNYSVTGLPLYSSHNYYLTALNSNVESTNSNTISLTTFFGGVVSTLAGSTQGYTDRSGTSAQFNNPLGVALDSSGNIYVADQNNNRIRKVTSVGSVTTLAGAATAGYFDGTGTYAQFNSPRSIAIDSSGNLYVTDQNNNRIRKITSAGVVTTLAGNGTQGFLDGTPTNAMFKLPYGIALDSSGNVYVADAHNNRIRKIDHLTNEVTTLAGSISGYLDDIGTNAQFGFPVGVTVDSSGNVYVADNGYNSIRKIDHLTTEVTTFAGSAAQGSIDGTGTNARFYQPYGLATDTSGNVYVAEYGNNRIRKITSAGVVTTIAGSASGYLDGTGTNAQFSIPQGLVVDSSDNVYVADTGNHRIRKIQ